MPRKVVRVYLPPIQKDMLRKIAEALGMKESEVMRYAFLKYAQELSLVSEKVHVRGRVVR